MSENRLNHEEFLTRLAVLFTKTHTNAHGSVFLIQKPLVLTDSTSPSSQILIRATNGKSKPHRIKDPGLKEKLSTVVDMADAAEFYVKYAEVCKKGMEGLRKRDKRKAKAKRKVKSGAGGPGTGAGITKAG